MEMEIDINKKWKYLHFLKDDGYDGWRLGLSDEPSGVPRSKLLSIAEIKGRVKRDEPFGLVFEAIASDPQLIECADGLYEAVNCFGSEFGSGCSGGHWRFFPVRFNRIVYRQFSHYVRRRKQFNPQPIVATDMMWMNIPQLQMATRLLTELFDVQDLSEIDRLIDFKQDNPVA